MTLSRGIVLRNLGLLGGLVLVVGAAVWGLMGLREDVHRALQAYQYMKSVEIIEPAVAGAVERLRASPPAVDDAEGMLRSAKLEAERFSGQLASLSLTTDSYGGTAKQRASEVAEQLGVALGTVRTEPEKAREQAQATLGQLKQLNDLCMGFMRRTEEAAADHVNATLLLMAQIGGGVFLIAVVLSVHQHRAIIRPLEALRQGARRLAAHEFTERVVIERSPAEFVELADDFNRMAAELDEFYHRLEQRVAMKSKELVRSERLASLGFLAAGVAHEINNPLSIIAGYAELLMNRVERNEDGAEAVEEVKGPAPVDLASDLRQSLQIIKDEAFRGKEITGKLLSLARTSERREVVAMTSLCHEMATLMAGLKNYRDRRLVLRFDENDPLHARGNVTELKQVILNVTVNALEATAVGKGEVCIEGRRVHGWVELMVRDNGRGMSADVIDRVFEPFFSEKRGAGETGTGLGLCITHAIVEAHDGRIWAESDGPGRGSRFMIRLPAEAEVKQAKGAAGSRENATEAV